MPARISTGVVAASTSASTGNHRDRGKSSFAISIVSSSVTSTETVLSAWTNAPGPLAPSAVAADVEGLGEQEEERRVVPDVGLALVRQAVLVAEHVGVELARRGVVAADPQEVVDVPDAATTATRTSVTAATTRGAVTCAVTERPARGSGSRRHGRRA